MKRESGIKRMTVLAMLSAVALIIFTVEAQIPMPLQGVKLGLANIVTLFVLYRCGSRESLAVLLARVVLGAVVTGRLGALAYSLTGGLFCLAVCVILRPLLRGRIWPLSMCGAVFHNVGQLLAACVMAKSPAVLAYFPVLLVSGLATGLFTGLLTQLLLPKLEKPLAEIRFSGGFFIRKDGL